MSKLLSVKGVQTNFITTGKCVKAVVDATFDLDRGEIIGVVGESGSGKSVTMMSILKLINPPGKVVGGEVYLEGVEGNILELDPKSEEMRAIRGGKIAMIFQEPMTSLNPVLTVGYQIAESLIMHKHCLKEEARQLAIELLKAVRIPDAEQRYDDYPMQFSGGMRQRIMIAIALAGDPDVLIADEATTALDVTIQAQLLEMMRDIAKERGVAIIIVTHNMGVVARYADRIYVMYSGSVVETAPTRELFKSPEHPYTRGLLAAIPRLTDSKERVLVPIDGLLPDASCRAPYCAFFDRCKYRTDHCKEHPVPALRETGEGHFSACLYSKEQLDARERELASDVKRAPEKHISDEAVLTVKGLSKRFSVRAGLFQKKVGEVHALENVSFEVKKGETLGLVGESGCGKSTLARCIMRAYEPNEGEIFFNGRDIARLKEGRLRDVRKDVAMVFQDPFSSLDPRQTAESIVGESLKIHKLCKTEQEYQDRVDEMFRLVELDPELKKRVPHEFSGGQRQRLGIARALASDPKLIICDEPISALDVSVQAQIINLLERIQSELGVSYIFIAHDLAVVKHISDRIMVMYLGTVVEIASCEEIYENPLHPYTQALLVAVPTADPEAEIGREALRLDSEIPSVMDRPKGCPFSNRCPKATERCRAEHPGMYRMAEGHEVACFLYEGKE